MQCSLKLFISDPCLLWHPVTKSYEMLLLRNAIKVELREVDVLP